jgi:hypothetical protein
MTADELERSIRAGGHAVTLGGAVREAVAKKAIGCSQKTMLAMRQDGSGPPYFKLNGVHWYRLDKLAAWLTERMGS